MPKQGGGLLREFFYGTAHSFLITKASAFIGEGVRQQYEEILTPQGMDDIAIFTELGRFMLAPYGLGSHKQ